MIHKHLIDINAWWPVVPVGSVVKTTGSNELMKHGLIPATNYTTAKIIAATSTWIVPSFWVGPVGGFVVSMIIIGIFFTIRDFVVQRGW
jgi:hypothetical protein